MFPRYSTIHILVLLQTTSTPEIASNILALQAGLILIPLHITLHYTYAHANTLIHRSSEDRMIEILERLYEHAPLREGVWGDSYDDRSFLTENETPLQKWYECIPSVNPFAACFLASTVMERYEYDI
jgi:singapore isolate B (sub-type 7) whole genome shotgun sequence assembly, scaffold_4